MHLDNLFYRERPSLAIQPRQPGTLLDLSPSPVQREAITSHDLCNDVCNDGRI